MKAEPSSRRQAMSPISLTMTLAQKPRKIPAIVSLEIRSTGYERRLTNHDPKLPEHDEGTSNSGGGVLSGVDGDCGGFDTHTDTHEQTAGELES